jgi:hypothetical protein
MDRGQQLTNLLIESGWRHMASTPVQGTPNTLDIWSKNGRIVIVEEGVELFYPSSQQTLTDLVAEANAYAMDATSSIASNTEC